ncbi:hypothetical protein BDF14DRAFT_1883169 [Spinellus fusiger]|nr:hypothetical protein BDF14DRAFT_1883169 [Spinellus fusiger]
MAISITDKRRVALAYDGSEDAQKLFEWSLKNIIHPDNDHILILSVVSAAENGRRSSEDKKAANEDLKNVKHPEVLTARDRLLALSTHLHTLKISFEEHILWGDAKVLIPRYTQQNKVDLLIVGSRGLGTIKSVILGSVSDRCIHECPCPVVVVRNTSF